MQDEPNSKQAPSSPGVVITPNQSVNLQQEITSPIAPSPIAVPSPPPVSVSNPSPVISTPSPSVDQASQIPTVQPTEPSPILNTPSPPAPSINPGQSIEMAPPSPVIEQPIVAPPNNPAGAGAVDLSSSPPQPPDPGNSAVYQDIDTSIPDLANDNISHVEWTASEYMADDKNKGWYIILGLVTIVIATLVYFISGGEIVSTVMILIVGVAFGAFSVRKPQVLPYSIDSSGINIGNKHYTYESFKWFSIVEEGALGYIYMMPLKRFMPPLTIHYDPADEDKIADTLSAYLPYEDYTPSIFDDVAKRFRI